MKDLNEDLIREAMDDLRSRLYAAVTENRQLKAQLEKAKCCGSCRHIEYGDIDSLGCEIGCEIRGNGHWWTAIGDGCDKWEVRE